MKRFELWGLDNGRQSIDLSIQANLLNSQNMLQQTWVNIRNLMSKTIEKKIILIKISLIKLVWWLFFYDFKILISWLAKIRSTGVRRSYTSTAVFTFLPVNANSVATFRRLQHNRETIFRHMMRWWSHNHDQKLCLLCNTFLANDRVWDRLIG